MIVEARLLTVDGDFVTQISVSQGMEPPAEYRHAGRQFNRDRSIELASGDVVWIYTGPPEPPPPEPPSLDDIPEA